MSGREEPTCYMTFCHVRPQPVLSTGGPSCGVHARRQPAERAGARWSLGHACPGVAHRWHCHSRSRTAQRDQSPADRDIHMPQCVSVSILLYPADQQVSRLSHLSKNCPRTGDVRILPAQACTHPPRLYHSTAPCHAPIPPQMIRNKL